MRSGVSAAVLRSLNMTPFSPFDPTPLLPPPAYLAVVNAACERAPMIYPRAVSDGQFYSPPESVAGDALLCPLTLASACPSYVFYFLYLHFWL